MLQAVVSRAPIFLLICARCFALIMTLPLFGSRTISRTAKIALTGYIAYFILGNLTGNSGNPYQEYYSYLRNDGAFNLEYVFLLGGEALIGIIMGFFVQIVFSVFSTAGQFFAFQMGFAASEVYDSLSQVENPLMGQFLNFMAMIVFLQTHGVQKLFVGTLLNSCLSLNAFTVVAHAESTKVLMTFMLKGLTFLFRDSFILALPLMGCLFLINITMGVLSKAAPQMNLLSEGFPILMLTAFFLIWLLIPHFFDFFARDFKYIYRELMGLFTDLSGGGL